MFRKLKKTVSAILCTAIICGTVAGCTGDNSSNAGTDSSTASDDNTSQFTGLVTEQQPIRDITSLELMKEFKIGWSLGNTLDAGDAGKRGSYPETIERAWGNPITTKEMIDEVVKAGFNIIRIPVTWDWSTGPAPDYKISDEWMNRVQQVVDYAVANDVFVILNLHHETWHYPTVENKDKAVDRLKKVWTQIGTRFQNYNEKLIFEGLNEPRVIGTDEEWNGGSTATREIVNVFNATFIETIRGLGGNNPKRHLMIPSYAASSTEMALSDLKIPENDDKIIVSVHAYTPYNFALSDKHSGRWFAAHAGSVADIDTLYDTIKKLFVDKGQAVLIGEFGARSRGNEYYTAEWAKYYITKMKEIGVSCVWWDNNAVTGSGELFGLFNRRTLEWHYPLLLEAMIDATDGKFTIEELKATPIETDKLDSDLAKAS